ncbi:hypothetical protein CAC42_7200 [Sphaceloma murrayae]|uniref:Stress response protein NST1 n=1 Tax=Sphaceloma murrayae TaxID=2082308 RepID=A0A2K1QPY5_9PEZI|nr:hypothetical protein CAC42_7200 [Sphaceloma murrayae]
MSQAPPVNGVLTARGPVGGNRKKQKRRAKLAAKQNDSNMNAGGSHDDPHSQPAYSPPPNGYDQEYTSQQPYDDQYDYSSEESDEPIVYDRHYQHMPNGQMMDPPSLPRNKKKKRKNKGHASDLLPPSSYHNHAPLPPSLPTMPSQRSKSSKDSIWNTSTQEERERIKEFWLSLSEDKRKDLLRIEKNAVLTKMKEQQKHSCSCTVCGRKRIAIEEELEVLYDAYYDELAQYANHQDDVGVSMLDTGRAPLPHPHAHALPPRPLNTPAASHHRTSRVQEILDDADQAYSDEEDEEVYSDEEEETYSDEEDYETDLPHGFGSGFFDFGQNLQVKGGSFITDMLTHLHGRLNNLPDGILTVADDLLKNDGRKFIEMMESLAERRMQREQEVEYASHQPAHHGEPPLDDEDDYDEEDDYDSQDEYDDDEEEDEMGGMTEAQRMEEGRRMFQIFAARMFEQRVLTAYREKVAAERQERLIMELEEEDKAKSQKDAQRAKNAEKKKNKKLAQKHAKNEEKLKREAEERAKKEAEEAEERRKAEEARIKRDEQKRKKDELKRQQDEERARKEAERLKRLAEERERQQEAERKAREQKAQEKRQRDEAKRKEREQREAQEKTAREQKALEEKLKKEQELKAKSDRRASEAKPAPAQPSQILKRPSQSNQVAVPPALVSRKSATALPSPHIPIATPAIPKAATPGVRTRRSSEQEPQHTPPKATTAPTGPSKTRSPLTTQDAPAQQAPKTILQNPHKQRPAVQLPQPASHQGPPPGMHPPFPGAGGFGNMGFPTFGAQGVPPHQRTGPQFPHQPPPPGPFRGFPSNNLPPVSTGFGSLPSGGRGFGGDAAPPPGFAPQVPGLGSHAAPGMPSSRAAGSHSRQQSADLDRSPPAHAQPISRPAPIQRPSSVRPSAEHHESGEIDDLSRHLGSRALLDDGDDPLPPAAELRRTSNPIGAPRNPHMGFNNSSLFSAPPNSFGGPPGNWPSPSPGAFGPSSGLSTPNWGGPLGSGSWSTSSFGPLNVTPRPANRSRAIRLAICHACRQLTSPGNEYHDVSLILQQISRDSFVDVPPTLKEIEDICETEGDSTNGGGLLHVRHSGPNFAVKFEMEPSSSTAGRPNGGSLGEIGSPVPGNSVPAAFGRGFGSIGGVASPGAF